MPALGVSQIHFAGAFAFRGFVAEFEMVVADVISERIYCSLVSVTALGGATMSWAAFTLSGAGFTITAGGVTH